MIAVVDINGQQLKVEENKTYYVNRLSADVDSEIEFDKVLLVAEKDDTKVGAPTVEGAKVTAKVLEHLKDEKIIVFKMKRRKDYRKKHGHRQYLTRIEITKIAS